MLPRVQPGLVWFAGAACQPNRPSKPCGTVSITSETRHGRWRAGGHRRGGPAQIVTPISPFYSAWCRRRWCRSEPVQKKCDDHTLVVFFFKFYQILWKTGTVTGLPLNKMLPPNWWMVSTWKQPLFHFFLSLIWLRINWEWGCWRLFCGGHSRPSSSKWRTSSVMYYVVTVRLQIGRLVNNKLS